MLVVENHKINPRCEIGLIGWIGEIILWPERVDWEWGRAILHSSQFRTNWELKKGFST